MWQHARILFRAFSEDQDGEIGHIQKISKDKNGAE